jgi:hypothetical protein
MLIIAKGSCDQCKIPFGPLDMIQSVGVDCETCDTKRSLCRRCKAAGCECGGRFLDARERFEKEHPGNSIIF